MAGSTGIVFGAGVAIIARGGVGSELTTCIGVTRIVGTGVAIVAAKIPPAGTFPKLAGILHGAEVIVVAGQGVEGVYATLCRVARIGGAEIQVIAVNGPRIATDGTLADISSSARIAIVTVRPVGRVLATGGRVARVIGARIAVVAIYLLASTTVASHTLVEPCADIIIGARSFPGDMLTAAVREALVCCARVLVIAIGGGFADAGATRTVVPGGALVVV